MVGKGWLGGTLSLRNRRMRPPSFDELNTGNNHYVIVGFVDVIIHFADRTMGHDHKSIMAYSCRQGSANPQLGSGMSNYASHEQNDPRPMLVRQHVDLRRININIQQSTELVVSTVGYTNQHSTNQQYKLI